MIGGPHQMFHMNSPLPRRFSAVRIAAGFFLLTGTALATGTVGRDFRPSDWTGGVINPLANPVYDAFGFDNEIWVLYGSNHDILADTFDPTYGATGQMSGSPVTLLTHDTSTGSVEMDGLNSAQMGLCSLTQVSNDTLTWDGSKWRTTHIGIRRASITLSGTGTCIGLGVTTNSFVPGYENSGTYKLDGFNIDKPLGCSNVLASYDYTTCSFAGNDAYRCEMDPDPISDGNPEYGFCMFMMVYEADYDGDGSQSDSDSATNSPDDRVLLVAHAQHVDGPWVKYAPDTPAYPTTSDIRVQNTSEHQDEGADGIHSFVSVPALHYDTTDGLWRMWFVTEDAGDHSVRYTESDDNGQSWGMGGGGGGTIDCWNGAAFDSSACVNIDWVGTPPPDSTVDTWRSPDIVDPEAIWGNFDGSPGNELGMMFTGGDDGCGSNDWGVQLWQIHADHGDQSGGTKWDWKTSVAADGTNGKILDPDTGFCGTAGDPDFAMDPEIVPYNGGYLAFFNGYYVSTTPYMAVGASGFACSDFVDNDSGGGTDYPLDVDCDSPWDPSE